MTEILTQSDKFYWHQYVDFYETFLQNTKFNNIAELGVFEGASIKWLLARFPYSKIFGADILSQKSNWPVDDRVKYYKLNQANRTELCEFFNQAIFDLIIEDGSHEPQHQVNCLLEGLPKLADDGVYILEDIHSSLNRTQGNALTVLLAIDHFQKIGQVIDKEIAEYISLSSLMNADEVYMLSKLIKNISFYRRSRLPLMCYNCGSKVYNFSELRCLCGVKIFDANDSMTCVIKR